MGLENDHGPLEDAILIISEGCGKPEKSLSKMYYWGGGKGIVPAYFLEASSGKYR